MYPPGLLSLNVQMNAHLKTEAVSGRYISKGNEHQAQGLCALGHGTAAQLLGQVLLGHLAGLAILQITKSRAVRAAFYQPDHYRGGYPQQPGKLPLAICCTANSSCDDGRCAVSTMFALNILELMRILVCSILHPLTLFGQSYLQAAGHPSHPPVQVAMSSALRALKLPPPPTHLLSCDTRVLLSDEQLNVAGR